jgi:hypothetical protein
LPRNFSFHYCKPPSRAVLIHRDNFPFGYPLSFAISHALSLLLSTWLFTNSTGSPSCDICQVLVVIHAFLNKPCFSLENPWRYCIVLLRKKGQQTAYVLYQHTSWVRLCTLCLLPGFFCCFSFGSRAFPVLFPFIHSHLPSDTPSHAAF